MKAFLPARAGLGPGPPLMLRYIAGFLAETVRPCADPSDERTRDRHGASIRPGRGGTLQGTGPSVA